MTSRVSCEQRIMSTEAPIAKEGIRISPRVLRLIGLCMMLVCLTALLVCRVIYERYERGARVLFAPAANAFNHMVHDFPPPPKIGTIMTAELMQDYQRRQEEFLAEAQSRAHAVNSAFNAYQAAHGGTASLVPILSRLSVIYAAFGLVLAACSFLPITQKPTSGDA